jgi:DNA-binding GntR family transcriptional regulator
MFHAGDGMAEDSEPRRAKGTGARHAYEILRDEILSLTLAPGALLDETTLADRFAMSRSPVREALIRLAGEDLVVTLANRSTIVAPIDLQAFPRYVEALDLAQRMNTRLAAERRSEADLKAIIRRQKAFVGAVQGRSHLAMSEANRAFHMAIAEAGGNPYLAAFYDRLLNQGRRILHLHFRFLEQGGSGHLLTDEHDEMIEAIRARDVARADGLAHAHTRQFQAQFVDYMRHNALEGVPLGAGPGAGGPAG